MKRDPNAACANAEQRLLWAVLHDAVAHPLMALTGYCALAVRFHDYTSRKAWPRSTNAVVAMSLDKLLVLESICRANGLAFVSTGAPLPDGGYSHKLELL